MNKAKRGLNIKNQGEMKTEDKEQKLYGHKKMKVWQNIDKLDVLVQKIVKRIPDKYLKLKNQIDDAFDKLSMQTMYLLDRLRFSLENKKKEMVLARGQKAVKVKKS